jgi:hypothetical protein
VGCLVAKGSHGGPWWPMLEKRGLHIYIYIFIYRYMYVYTYIYIYIYTGQLAIKFDDPGKLELLKSKIKILQIYPPIFYFFGGWDP